MTPSFTPGHLAQNIAHFARALRVAGIPVGPRSVLEALEAVQVAEVGSREDFYWTLHSSFVTKREHSVLFDQAFRLFWRRRSLIEKMIQMLTPFSPMQKESSEPKPLARVSEAMFGGIRDEEMREKPRVELDARMSMSDAEVLRVKDFEQMTALEIAAAKRAIAALKLPMDRVRTRRFQAASQGRIDPRATLRASLRGGAGMIDLQHRKVRAVRPPVVAICDISGSMGDYSRMFLHFLHTLGASGREVHTFLFATELTNVTRLLRASTDPELALAACGRGVRDWDGGTRISGALAAFNRDWARRMLAGGAVVLFISDGLERQDDPMLAREMERLRRSCRRLIWLNPLLRYDAFEAKAAGIRALLPHVDEFRSIHSLASMQALCEALGEQGSAAADPKRWLKTG
jgi:uncharacterized protein